MNPTLNQIKDTTHFRRGSRKDVWIDILIFLIPCLQFVQVKVVGSLSGSDLMILAVFLYFANNWKIKITTPVGKTFVTLCSLWLVSQVVTDIIRHMAFENYARGWSMIGMTLISFVSLYTLLYEQPRRLVLYGWGLVAGGLLTVFISPVYFAEDDPWKFGFGMPVSLAVFVLVSSEKFRGRWAITLAVLIGAFDIYKGSRGLGGECLAAAFYLFATGLLRGNGKAGSRVKTGTILTLAASIILGIAGTAWAYRYAATAGILGDDARDKYETESSGEYGLLLGGRPDLLGSIPAIYDSPILGHGSWAVDWRYLLAEQDALRLLGYKQAIELTREDYDSAIIPAHSFLLQAWVFAGIAGAVFWAWVLGFTVKTFMRIYPPTAPLLPLFALLALSLTWDILFSPYGSTERIYFPYCFVMLMTLASVAPRKAVRTAIVKGKKKEQCRIRASAAAQI
jgi:hypothetical protein